MANNGRANCGVLSWAILVATLFISRVDYTSSFQILSTAQALLLGAPMATSSSVVSRTSSSSPPTVDNVPAVLLSQASSRIVNGMYEPRDPASIDPRLDRPSIRNLRRFYPAAAAPVGVGPCLHGYSAS